MRYIYDLHFVVTIYLYCVMDILLPVSILEDAIIRGNLPTLIRGHGHKHQHQHQHNKPIDPSLKQLPIIQNKRSAQLYE